MVPAGDSPEAGREVLAARALTFARALGAMQRQAHRRQVRRGVTELPSAAMDRGASIVRPALGAHTHALTGASTAALVCGGPMLERS